MAKKRTAPRIGNVSFTYVGTDQDFNKFLKTVAHDYLMVGQMSIPAPEKTIKSVEKSPGQ